MAHIAKAYTIGVHGPPGYGKTRSPIASGQAERQVNQEVSEEPLWAKALRSQASGSVTESDGDPKIGNPKNT